MVSESELRTVKSRVRRILETCPDTRNSDKLLIVRYYSQWHNMVRLDEILDPALPPFETVRRMRQEIQHAGEFLPCLEVDATRTANEYILHGIFANGGVQGE